MMVSPVNYRTVISLDIIIHNEKAILMASAKSNGSLVTNKELILVEASFIDVECLMVRNIRVFGSVGVITMYFSCQISALAIGLRLAILITSGSTGKYILNLLTFLDRLRRFLHVELGYVSMAIFLHSSQILDPYIDHDLQLQIFFFMMLDSILNSLESYRWPTFSNFRPSMR